MTISNTWECLKSRALKTPDQEAIIHLKFGEEPYRWTWRALIKRAGYFSQIMRQAGVKQGDVCALIVRHNVSFYPIYLAVSSLGALPAVLAYPNPRLHPDKFRQGLEGMSRRSGLDWLITERDLEPMVAPLALAANSTIRGIMYPLEEPTTVSSDLSDVKHPSVDPDSACLLQHSSGTTGLQKAVVLSHRAVLEHVKRYGTAIEIRPDDRIVSWLPLYHDMGLIAAFYLPLVAGIPLVQLDPFEWVTAPVIFLEALFNERGTLGWLPNFAYNLMANQIRDDDIPSDLNLESVRMLINCSEPVRADSHERFYRRFSRFGLRRSSLGACYAMAETTFAVTQTSPGAEAKQIMVSRESIAQGSVSLTQEALEARICVSSGRLISGCECRVVGEDGVDVSEGSVGEIVIKSVSLFNEYRNDPQDTRLSLRDGWYYSGDYGFMLNDELYVVGRKKDLIIVAGKNIYPEDVEDAISQVPNIIPGRVVSFGNEDSITGTEQVCVIAETALESEDDLKRLRREVMLAGMRVDVTISQVYLVPPRWLIKSSSGKPSRKQNRDRALFTFSRS